MFLNMLSPHSLAQNVTPRRCNIETIHLTNKFPFSTSKSKLMILKDHAGPLVKKQCPDRLKQPYVFEYLLVII